MKFTTERHGDTLVVRLPKQLIAENRQELKQRVLDALASGVSSVLLDFARTGYIDSAGLGALVSLAKATRERGGELRLSNLNADLRTLFSLTKLDELFGIEESDDAEGRTAPPSRVHADSLRGGTGVEPPEAEAR